MTTFFIVLNWKPYYDAHETGHNISNAIKGGAKKKMGQQQLLNLGTCKQMMSQGNTC